MRMTPGDARYAGDLVDGGRIMQLFGDLATELSIMFDGDEGLFCAYDSVEFLAPLHSGDFIEAEGVVTEVGNTSRRMSFVARRRIAPSPAHGPTAADVLDQPEVLARASGTVVVPADRQRKSHASPSSNGSTPAQFAPEEATS
jgi:3-aminobutyryl-CoA ammonia-lyase